MKEIGIKINGNPIKICDCPVKEPCWLADQEGNLIKFGKVADEEIEVELYKKEDDGKIQDIPFVIDNPCVDTDFWYLGISFEEGKYYFLVYTTDVETYDITDIVLQEKQTMKIINENNVEEEVEVILAYIDQATNLEYVIYTTNEIDENGEIIVSSSRVDRTGGTAKLVGMSDEEWERVQIVLNTLKE